MWKWVQSLTGRFMLYTTGVLLVLMGSVYLFQSNEIRKDVEGQLLDKGRSLAMALSRSVQSVTEADMQTGVTLSDGTRFTGDEVKKRLFDDKLQLIPESELEAAKRSKDPAYASGKQVLFNGKEIPLSQYELKYRSAYDAYTDDRWQKVIDAFLTDDQVVFALPIAFSANPDYAGYIATHNTKYSATGGSSKDDWGVEGLLSQKYRANRVFNDTTGYQAAANQNTSDVLLQKYPRILEGKTVETWDISYPLLLDGKHWGGVRVALSKEASDALIAKQQRTLLLELTGLFAGMLLLIWALSQFAVGRKLRFMLQAAVNLNSHEANLAYRIPIRSKDELGRLGEEINGFIAHLQEMIGTVRRLTSQVTVTAGQLSEGAAQSAASASDISRAVAEVAAGAETQATSAEDSAKAMEEMAVGIQRIAESSAQVTEASLSMVDEAKLGREASHGAMGQMLTLSDSADAVGSAIRQLNERMDAVGEMAAVITGIASQTSLLALNAAIEAARAGEQGKGFAVVAGEVRKLAEQSEESSREINEQIAEIQASMKQAVAAMETGGREVAHGVEEVKRVGEAFERIVATAQQVSGQIQEISAASEQMSAGTEEVTAGIEEMSRIAGEAAQHMKMTADASAQQLVSADQTATQAGSLRETAEQLEQTVGRFRV
ncbi:methyl-accepting chemotaxis protein [Paenibacillus silviterrae]|uniref:methyl-accepting chemotaxis protein n=1 Tax=Paenibacillus silviterrae TaxID=3242194 RepID=UPI002542DB1A|nr:HAMP domain-containing methyl-accepting chemotaxis protein [Paenibacillus chinjuensis]